MSRPIYEPNIQRTAARLNYGQEQLFRRPGRVGGTAIYEIKVFEDDEALVTGDDKFVWEIPEDLDQAAIVKAEAYVSTAGGSATTVQIRLSDPCDTGANILSTPITIDTGDCNSKDAATQPVVIDPTVADWGDHLHIDVDAAGSGAMGLGVIVVLAPAALASVVLTGAVGPQGPAGGITDWTGQWQTATAYTTNQSVSNNGSSYAAIQDHTSGTDDDEPGVGANWETYWQLLAEAGAQGATQASGWVDDTANTWTYASASTFTMTGDRTAEFTPGTRLQFTQTTVKYGVVHDSSFGGGNTTVTIIVNTDYVLANAAISVNSYSHIAAPAGYPMWFEYAPTIVGWSSTTKSDTRFLVIGNTCWLELSINGTSNSATTTVTLPTTAASSDYPIGVGWFTNNAANVFGRWYFTSTTVWKAGVSATSDTWTASNNKGIDVQLFFQF